MARNKAVWPLGIGLAVALAVLTVLQEEAPAPPSRQDTPSDERAAGQAKSGPPPAPAARPRPVSRAETQVGLDPSTGRLLPPTPAQRTSLADALRRQFAPVRHAPDSFADGTISVVVATERLNFSVARVNERGLPEMSCVPGLEQAATVLEADGYSGPLRAED